MCRSLNNSCKYTGANPLRDLNIIKALCFLLPNDSWSHFNVSYSYFSFFPLTTNEASCKSEIGNNGKTCLPPNVVIHEECAKQREVFPCLKRNTKNCTFNFFCHNVEQTMNSFYWNIPCFQEITLILSVKILIFRFRTKVCSPSERKT